MVRKFRLKTKAKKKPVEEMEVMRSTATPRDLRKLIVKPREERALRLKRKKKQKRERRKRIVTRKLLENGRQHRKRAPA